MLISRRGTGPIGACSSLLVIAGALRSTCPAGYAPQVKLAQMKDLGPVAELLQRQVDDLGAVEMASQLIPGTDARRMRILVATDLGVLDYVFAATSGDANAPWHLRGTLTRWPGVHGLRLQTDGQLGDATQPAKHVWRFVIEDPKAELVAEVGADAKTTTAMLEFARACLERAGN